MMDGFDGWGITCRGSLIFWLVRRRRVDAIADLCWSMDATCHDMGYPHYTPHLNAAQQRAWAKLRRHGYATVRVWVEACEP